MLVAKLFSILFTSHAGALSAVPLTPAVATATAQVRTKGINGKRKLPGPTIGAVGPRSPSGTLVPSISGFVQEKRACRPIAALQKVAPDYQLNNPMGLSG